MRIVFMGTPEFAVESLKALVNAGKNICAVVTVPDKPAGRGLQTQKSDIKQYAETIGLPILQPIKLKDEAFISQLKKINADLFVVVAFRMLPDVVWQMPEKGTINLHGSLLPNYRGAAPINWAIINGEKITGITTFFIEKEIDMGKIINFEEVKIKDTDNAGIIHDTLMTKGAELLLKTVNAIEEGGYETYSQSQFIIPGQELKNAPKINRQTCKINWCLKIENIYNHIRGLSPYPGAWTTIENIETKESFTIKIFSSAIIEGQHNSKETSCLSDGKTYLYITTEGGLISLLEIQPEGRKRMSIEDFLRGQRGVKDWRIKDIT